MICTDANECYDVKLLEVTLITLAIKGYSSSEKNS